MKYYAVAEVNVTDPHWVSGYLAQVNRIVERHGGRYLARTSRHEMMEGEAMLHQTSIILEFPSKDAAYSFYNSDEYRPLRDARVAGSSGKLYFVAGEDAARQ